MQILQYQFEPSRNLWVLSSIDGSPNYKGKYVAGCLQQEISVQWEHASQFVKNKDQAFIHVQPVADRIRIGPLIGILTVGKGNRLYGNKANFIDIMRTGKLLGAFVYVFTPQDINWESNQVRARLFDNTTGRWITSTLPFPDVVYNRIPNRQYEAENEVQLTLTQLQQIPNLKLFNPRFFDKWELYQMLQTSHLATHIPDTSIISSEETLKNYLLKYQKLYIKPSSGKAGKGIFYVEQQNNNYNLKSTQDRFVRKRHPSLRSLWNSIQPQLQQNRYIVQQAIPLLTYNGRPFDVRVLVQKDIRGTWKVSGIGIRVAGVGGITTHVPQGGKIVSVKQALYPHFGKNGTQNIVGNIQDTALKVANTIEQHFEHLGEMSMDIGITEQGQLWFFEANAKPMKFDEPNIRSTSLRRIIEYSMYLSRFVE